MQGVGVGARAQYGSGQEWIRQSPTIAGVIPREAHAMAIDQGASHSARRNKSSYREYFEFKVRKFVHLRNFFRQGGRAVRGSLHLYGLLSGDKPSLQAVLHHS